MNASLLRSVTGIFLFLVLGIGIVCRSEDTKRGLNVGEEVPISSMRCVVGEPNDRNTCLAGKYRTRRTISIYAKSPDEPKFTSLLKNIEAILADNGELRGYVLLLNGSQFDQALKDRLRDLARSQELSRLDLAIANGRGSASFAIPEESEVVVVYSDKLRVKYRHDFEKSKLDESSIKAVSSELQNLIR